MAPAVHHATHFRRQAYDLDSAKSSFQRNDGKSGNIRGKAAVTRPQTTVAVRVSSA